MSLKLLTQSIKRGTETKQAIIETSKIIGMKPTELLIMIKEMQDKKKAKQDDELEK